MEKSEHINELASALAKAQGEMKGAIKDSSNPFYKSKYSDLASVFHAIGEPFAKNGLSVVQTTSEGAGGTMLHTTLLHSSGQFISGGILVKPVKNDPQGLGSALTYYRRYALSAIAGVYSEDDDGNAASGKQVGHAAQQPPSTSIADQATNAGYNPADYFEAFPPEDVPVVSDMFPGLESKNTQTKDRSFNVGKFKGKKFSEVTDPSYIHWVKGEVEHNFGKCGSDLKNFYAFLQERGFIK